MDSPDAEYKPGGRGGTRAPGTVRYQAQRTLIRWNPELEARLLVVYDYVMKQQGYKIPYDIIAQHLDPEKATSGAIEQHISKVRKLHNEKCAGNPVPAPSRQVQRRGATAVADTGRVSKSRHPQRGKNHLPSAAYADDEYDDDEQSGFNTGLGLDMCGQNIYGGPYGAEFGNAGHDNASARFGESVSDDTLPNINANASTPKVQPHFGTHLYHMGPYNASLQHRNHNYAANVANPGLDEKQFDNNYPGGFVGGYNHVVQNSVSGVGSHHGIEGGTFPPATPVRQPVAANGAHMGYSMGPAFTTPSTVNTNQASADWTGSTGISSYDGYQYNVDGNSGGAVFQSLDDTSSKEQLASNNSYSMQQKIQSCGNGVHSGYYTGRLASPVDLGENKLGNDTGSIKVDSYEQANFGAQDFGNGPDDN